LLLLWAIQIQRISAASIGPVVLRLGFN